jgi:hypothetical protein
MQNGTKFMPVLVLYLLLLSALLELVICANWYPVILYSSGNGSQKNSSTCTDPNRRTVMSITGNGNLHVLVPTYLYWLSGALK